MTRPERGTQTRRDSTIRSVPMPPNNRMKQDIFMRATGVRRGGSACLDLAYTAEGIFGGFFECALSPWDIAAGALLVEEAGGVVTDFEGKNQYLKTGNIIAGTKGVQREMLKIIQATFRN